MLGPRHALAPLPSDGSPAYPVFSESQEPTHTRRARTAAMPAYPFLGSYRADASRRPGRGTELHKMQSDHLP